ncbi:unnamed protein product [Caretta caretta]
MTYYGEQLGREQAGNIGTEPLNSMELLRFTPVVNRSICEDQATYLCMQTWVQVPYSPQSQLKVLASSEISAELAEPCYIRPACPRCSNAEHSENKAAMDSYRTAG